MPCWTLVHAPAYSMRYSPHPGQQRRSCPSRTSSDASIHSAMDHKSPGAQSRRIRAGGITHARFLMLGFVCTLVYGYYYVLLGSLRVGLWLFLLPAKLWLGPARGVQRYLQAHLTSKQPCQAGADVHEQHPHVVISWPGFGILFFWQLGILSHLSATYDLSRLHLIGSSAGALVSILGACQVDPQVAVHLAHDLCVQRGVFRRPWGLAGVWGALVRAWLQQLLPADAADRCNGRVTVLVTQLPWLTTQGVTHFKDKEHLIDCALASAHIPWFMDGRGSADLDGRRCIDGSFCYIFFRRSMGFVPPGLPADRSLLFDPWTDRQLRSTFKLTSCLELTGLGGALALLKAGLTFAASPPVTSKLQSLLQPAAAAAGGIAGAWQQPHAGSTPEQQSEVAITTDVTLQGEYGFGADAEVFVAASIAPKGGMDLSSELAGTSCLVTR